MAVPALAKDDPSPFIGEKITYSIRQMGIKAGEAVLTYVGPAEKDGKKYTLITFRADGLNFLDEEKIYADPKSLLPLIVERDLNIFGKKEKITEKYDTKKGEVRIVKVTSDNKEEMTIKKDGALDNIYCFIYRYRRDGNFEVGNKLTINLPTLDLVIKLQEKTEIAAGGKKRPAFYMQSDPKKYRLWFETGEDNIPLRIDGAVGFGNTSMVMKEYLSESRN